MISRKASRPFSKKESRISKAIELLIKGANAMNANPGKPLAGITVVDFTHVLSGPFCTMLLADQGARVIKLEREKTGDDSRQFGPFYDDGTSVYYYFVNRGKESVVVNLKDNDDLALVKKMISKADVVVENFRPGTMAKLGLAPSDLVDENPRLIVCSISGFGQTGPMSQEPAYDTVVQALSGLMSVTGFSESLPTRVGTSIGDLSAGLFAYSAIATALAARERTGKGTTIDIAMLDGLFSLMEHGLMDSLAKKINPERIGNRHPSISPFDAYFCKDRLLVICCGNDALFDHLCDVLGLPELKTDERFVTNEKRNENQQVLKDLMEKSLNQDTADSWREKLEKAGIPVGIALTVTEAENLEQIRFRKMVCSSGDKEIPGNPIKFGAYDSNMSSMAPPKLDADGIKIREEFEI
jgi:CoA:oxalate CoA-transferase